MALVEFLTAMLDEDEAAVKAASHIQPIAPDPSHVSLLDPLLRLQQRMDPARVLRDIKSKRRIIERYQAATVEFADDPTDATYSYSVGLLKAMSELATTYANHPDYEQWMA